MKRLAWFVVDWIRAKISPPVKGEIAPHLQIQQDGVIAARHLYVSREQYARHVWLNWYFERCDERGRVPSQEEAEAFVNEHTEYWVV